MPNVNIGGVGTSEIVDMTQQEAVIFWSTGIRPERFGKVLKLANGKVVRNEYEAYWAAQPAEVQAIMDQTTEEGRLTLAHELVDKGFTIDVPIMVWGWDPLTTMIVRRAQGYTWVPSAKMPNVQVAPGVMFPGLPTYRPDVVPEGAIPVTIKWAEGFENTSPWLQGEKVELF